jgi:hypothetical protein
LLSLFVVELIVAEDINISVNHNPESCLVKNWIPAVVFTFVPLLLPMAAYAEPQIQGTPSELESYLNGVAKTVTLSAQESKDVVISSAEVKLRVESESPSLASAFKANLAIRTAIKAELKRGGIDAKQISESKFSSTPEYGFFGEKPKSYKVENILSIVVTSESQMIQVAALLDSGKDVYLVSSKAKKQDSKAIEEELIAKALLAVQEKARRYESQLGVKLVPVSFSESSFGAPEPVPMLRQRSAKVASYSSMDESAPASFGESKYNASVSVSYRLFAQ